MSLVLDALSVVLLLVNFGLAAVAGRAWRRHREPAAGMLALTFGILGAVVLAGNALPVHSHDAAVGWARKLVVAGLLLFPYCLYRFTASFEPPRVRSDRVAAAMTAAVVFATALVPRFPEQDELRPGWWAPFVVAVLVQWSALSIVVVIRLWQGGRDQGSIARKRMRTMAMGSVCMNVALLVAAAAGNGNSGITATGRALSVAAVVLFFVGYSPPPILRLLWRSPEVNALRDAEVALLAANTVKDVAHVLLPHVTRMVGGRGSAFVDRHGTVVAAHGLTADEATALLDVEDRRDVLGATLTVGRIVVQASPFAPFFGREEVELLRRLALFSDLALARAELLAEERRSRERAEQAGADLERFVYTVSHDLKSPLVVMLGFLDLLRRELGDEVTEDIAFFIGRMESSAGYMQNLIHDLLELSRIGRVQTEATEVDLDELVNDVVDGLRAMHPSAEFTVGNLPRVLMNPVRARQLFTNLVGNALTHAGRADVRVRVTAERSDEGGLRLLVADTGKGISRDDRERVFMPFQRLDDTAAPGTGIGLAVCRKIVEQAGGTIGVGDPPVGACFEIDLPGHLVRDAVPVPARAGATAAP
jgi:signal transduction histidine kinase